MIRYCLEDYSDKCYDFDVRIETEEQCEDEEIYPISEETIVILDMNVDIDSTQIQEFEIHTSYSKTLPNDFDYLCGTIEYVIDEGY